MRGLCPLKLQYGAGMRGLCPLKLPRDIYGQMKDHG
jgi:hypothetical protein